MGDADENMFFDEGEEESEEEEAEEGTGKVNKNLRQAKQNAMKNSTVAALDEDEDEDDEEDLDFDEEEEEEEDEDEESDEDDIVLQKAAAKQGKPQQLSKHDQKQ